LILRLFNNASLIAWANEMADNDELGRRKKRRAPDTFEGMTPALA
jgi:hypothetical protein